MIYKNSSVKFYLTIWVFQLSLLTGFQSLNAQIVPERKDANVGKIFRAGAATANITPPLGLGIVGNWGVPEATYIHDEIHVRCLILDDNVTQLVFIIVDNQGMKSYLIDEAKNLIQGATSIPKENIVISSTHTHSSVSASGEGEKDRPFKDNEPFDVYQQFLLKRFVDVTKIALSNLEPAQIGWGVGDVPEDVFVRRWKMKPGTPVPNPFGGQDKVKMNPGRGADLLEPAAKPDPEVSFISVRSIDEKPIALLANYSLHYVGGVPEGHISADYFAVFADRIQELLDADRQDPPFVGIMSNGTSGDVNNINFGAPAVEKAPYVQMRKVAEDVAREVFRVYNSVLYHDWVPLKAAEDKLTLKVRKPTREMLNRSKEIIAKPELADPVRPHELTYAKRILKLEEDWPDKIDITLQAFRIGDLGIATIPFEVFAETGLEIKAKSPFQPSFTIELANGNYGYLPTPEQHKLGGYETWMGTNKVEIEASTKIVAKLLDLFAKME